MFASGWQFVCKWKQQSYSWCSPVTFIVLLTGCLYSKVWCFVRITNIFREVILSRIKMTFCTLKGQWKGRRRKRESKSVHSCSLWIKYSYLNQATPQSETWANTSLPVFWKPCLSRGTAFSQQPLTESTVTACLRYLHRNTWRTRMGVNA